MKGCMKSSYNAQGVGNVSGKYYVDCSDLERLADKMAEFPRESDKAMVRSLNRTLSRVVTTTHKEVQEEYSPLRKGINSALKKERANLSKLQAKAIYTGNPLTLEGFKKKIPSNRFRAPVKVWVKKTPAVNRPYPVLFGARKGKVYKREIGTREIGGAPTVSVPQMVSNEDVYERIAKDAEQYLTKEFARDLEWRLSQLDD